jgi:biotin operon repressor
MGQRPGDVEDMLYQRSRQIESRLADLLKLIETGRFSTPKLAVALGISKPTVARCISALRERGYAIRSVKDTEGWAYKIADRPTGPRPPKGQRR